MEVTLKSDELTVALTKFFDVLTLTSDECELKSTSRIKAVIVFPTDERIRDARAWGAGALECGLVYSFSAISTM